MKLSCICIIINGLLFTLMQFISPKGLAVDPPSLLSLSSSTFSQRLINTLQNSLNLRRRYSQQPIDIISDKGEYLMKLFIGTPPVETLVVVDTGSDLTWIQCNPCTNCFRQKAPFFEPNLSSSYKSIACKSTPCKAIHGGSTCDGLTGTCRYSVWYGDSSFSRGYLATETVRLGSFEISNAVVGCGHYDRGSFGARASGILGLGGGKLSLISQMEASRFSYCLTGTMRFGDDAVVSGDDVATTPLVFKNPKTFYFLTLEGVSVGRKRIDSCAPRVTDGEGGNIIIDSGTTLTFLPRELYMQVEREVKGLMKMKEVDDPKGLLSLCYAWTSVGVTRVPEISFHFRGGDVKLKPRNTFVEIGKNCLCLGFAPTVGDAIFGNLAQMDFLVGYDLDNKTVSFKPADCSAA